MASGRSRGAGAGASAGERRELPSLFRQFMAGRIHPLELQQLMIIERSQLPDQSPTHADEPVRDFPAFMMTGSRSLESQAMLCAYLCTIMAWLVPAVNSFFQDSGRFRPDIIQFNTTDLLREIYEKLLLLSNDCDAFYFFCNKTNKLPLHQRPRSEWENVESFDRFMIIGLTNGFPEWAVMGELLREVALLDAAFDCRLRILREEWSSFKYMTTNRFVFTFVYRLRRGIPYYGYPINYDYGFGIP
jgi:hypothetical protein